MQPASTGFVPLYRGGVGSPLLCLHGFLDTWRTWELVLPALERRHEVLAPTLPGHAGGAALPEPLEGDALVRLVEGVLDDAGFERAHIVGNSLGGYLGLRLAALGRAESVVALAPAGGWAEQDRSWVDVIANQRDLQQGLEPFVPHAETIVATEEGRRRVTELVVERFEHIPAELLAHQLRGAARCAAAPMVDLALREGWTLDAEAIDCPVRIVWGAADRVLPWPEAAARYRDDWLPHADWIVLDGVGHAPQLDVPLETAELVAGFTR
jgi:pimeloyl-ACP methyl ester carboxylesterase